MGEWVASGWAGGFLAPLTHAPTHAAVESRLAATTKVREQLGGRDLSKPLVEFIELSAELDTAQAIRLEAMMQSELNVYSSAMVRPVCRPALARPTRLPSCQHP